MKKVKVIDLVSTKTGEIIGYFKKTDDAEVWDWVMYARDNTPVHIDFVFTWRLLDWTRAKRTNELWNDIHLLYRLM